MWIHEHPDWPQLSYQKETLAHKVAEIRHQQGRLLGKMETLGFDNKQEANLNTLTNDVIYTSAIEGEALNRTEVRSSIARHLGIEMAGLTPSNRHVDGIVEMMLDATQHFAKPLTQERLFAWHAALFPTGYSGLHKITVGNWRTPAAGPMQVVSGPIGRETIHFEAPNADRLEKEMLLFLTWFEQDNEIDWILKAGIAHLWFVTIHPFDDGNGRIARAIADMALTRADKTPDRFYSLSTQIESERKAYYKQLETQQKSNPDITAWLDWFLDCLSRALTVADKTLAHVVFKSKLWHKINRQSINERQKLIINRMLEEQFEGFMNTSKYAKIAKCSTDTALRDIQSLKTQGILIQNPGKGRNTSYRLTDKIS